MDLFLNLGDLLDLTLNVLSDFLSNTLGGRVNLSDVRGRHFSDRDIRDRADDTVVLSDLADDRLLFLVEGRNLVKDLRFLRRSNSSFNLADQRADLRSDFFQFSG